MTLTHVCLVGVTTSVLRPANRSNRMRHVLEALTDLLPASETYSYELDFDTSGELVGCVREGRLLLYKASCFLSRQACSS